MSFCRASDDSDVYLYGTGYELVLHVANNRGPAGNVASPILDSSRTKESIKAYIEDVVPLDSEYAGRGFAFTTYSDCIALLHELKASGLRVPQHAFDRLLREQTYGDNYPNSH